MRTKTLLIAVAAIAAGVVSSQAQSNVYSANIVGYANITLPAGYTLLNAPLSPNTTNNAEALLPSLTSGDQLLVWNGGGYDVDYFNGPGDWYNGVTFSPIAQPVLPPGRGYFYQNNTGATKTNTFVGTVGLTNTVTLAAGYTLVGSTAPIAGSIESTNFNLKFTSGDQVLIWNGGGYDVNYFNGPGDWYNGVSFSPIAVPSLKVGQGFFYQNNTGSATNWVENVVIQ